MWHRQRVASHMQRPARGVPNKNNQNLYVNQLLMRAHLPYEWPGGHSGHTGLLMEAQTEHLWYYYY